MVVSACVILALALIDGLTTNGKGFRLLERIELASFDWRVRLSSRVPSSKAEKLGVVIIDDATIAAMEEKLGHRWPLPRWVHGMVLKELHDRGVQSVAYDVFFVRPKDDSIPSKGGPIKGSSDRFFAQEMKRMGKVFLGVSDKIDHTGVQLPAPVFREAAFGFGHAVRFNDDDGIVRSVRPFIDDPVEGRLWQLGIVMAADRIGLDLDRAEVYPDRIRIPGQSGRERILPLDEKGQFMIRWSHIENNDAGFEAESLESILGSASLRKKRPDSPPRSDWRDYQIIVGSSGTDPLIADRGPTAASQDMPFFVVHLDVANSILQETYVHTTSPGFRLLIIGALVCFSSWISWRFKALWATLFLVGFIVAYAFLAIWLYRSQGVWIPMAIPVLGATSATHGVMVIWRLFLERSTRRQIRSAFQSVLAPDALDLVLQQPAIGWKSERREISVFFADIRGFTELTDVSINKIEVGDSIREVRQREGDEEALQTVNLYLGTVVETLIEYGAFIDKYMGDCVMAFWGAPLPRADHASTAVRAAIAAQRAIDQLNQDRRRTNREIEAANQTRPPSDQEMVLPILELGTGINSGMMTAGFMGTRKHLSNYTVFGKAVNIASRLESLSGNQRILISSDTARSALATDPELEPLFSRQGPTKLKGISHSIETFEVGWRSESFGIDNPNSV